MDIKLKKPVKWTVSVPGAVDVAVRTHLAQEGLRKGDLSKFVVEAIAGEVARGNVAMAREKNREVPLETLQAAVSEAVRAVRSESHREPP
jgi:hypothetical protein